MRRYDKIFIACAFIFFTAVPISAELYEYIDNGGIVHYTNNLTTIPTEYRSQLSRHVEAQAVSDKENIEAPDENPTDENPTGSISSDDQAEPDDTIESEPDVTEEEQEDQFDEESETSSATASGKPAKKGADTREMAELFDKRNTLEAKKDTLNKKLEGILQEKQQLENSKISPNNASIRKYNENVALINERIKQYKEEDAMLRGEIETFNETIKTHKQRR